MQKFYENTLQSKYIKSILYNTLLPTIDTLSEGDIAIKGNNYIIDNKIMKCKRTGKFRILENDDDVIARFDYIQDYFFGSYYPKFTSNFVSNTDYYDHDTHERLYKYLKCYKDIYKINLLPYYNIYSGNLTTNINITYDDNGKGYVYSKNYSDVKLLKVKIRFNKKYTIAIDCNSEVWVAPVFMMKDYFLTRKNEFSEDESITDLFINYNDKVTRYNYLSFKNPEIFEVENTSEEFAKYEKYLYLVIKLPVDNQSSVVILEGDYTNIAKESTFNMEYIDEDIRANDLDKSLCSELSLLQFNTGYSYPYSNRLFEYLILNAVTPQDPISNNIKNTLAGLPYAVFTRYTPGVWDDYTRAKVYKAAIDSKKIRHLDLNGFLDKDSESAIGGI